MGSDSSSSSSEDSSSHNEKKKTRGRKRAMSPIAVDEDLMSLMGGGGGSVRSRASRRSVGSSCKEDYLPIDHSAAKTCKCGFCGCLSSDMSPLLDPEAGDDDRVPWGKYRKVETDSGLVRVPTGTHDAICKNLYRLLGYEHKHGPHSLYLKKVESGSVDHTKFLSARDEFLKKQNKSGGKKFRSGKKDREELKAVTTLKTLSQTGTRFKGPEMTFVDVAEWSPSYGTLDESKVVEEVIGGKTVRGCYVMTGKKGHYKVQNYEDRACLVETEEHSRKDAKEIFAEQALQNKTDAINSVLQEVQKEREASVVSAKIMDTDGILAMLASGAIPLGAASAASSSASGLAADKSAGGQSAGQGHEEDLLSTDQSDSDDGAAVQARVAALGRKTKSAKAVAKSRPSAKAAPASSSSKAGKASSRAAETVALSVDAPSLARSNQVKLDAPAERGDAQPDVLALDGRGLRLCEALRREHQKLANDFSPLCLFGNDYNFTEKKPHAARNKQLSGVSSSITNQIKRIESSANKAAFQTEHKQFVKLKEAVTAAVEFNNALNSATSAPKALQEGYDALLPHGLKVGSCFWFKMLESKLNEKMTFRNLKEYGQALAANSAEALGGPRATIVISNE